MPVGLQSGNIVLRPARQEDLEAVWRIWNDKEVFKRSDSLIYIPKSLERFRKTFEDVFLKTDNPHFVIEVRGRVVGTCGLNINWKWRRTEVWIDLLPSEWGKGYGKTVISLLEDYAREDLLLERLRAEVSEWNERSVRLFESRGWEKIAYIPETEFKDGKWWGTLIYEKRLFHFFKDAQQL